MALTRREVLSSVRLTQRDAARLAKAIYNAKAKAYRTTLLEQLHRYGETHRKAVVLSPEIREALRTESRDHARKIVRTTNKAIERESKRRKDVGPEQLARVLAAKARDSIAARRSIIARQEIATARLDAMVQFQRENGVEPLFDFRGPPAKCMTCAVLKKNGPWPIEVVVDVGQPHIGCTHSWRARTVSADKLRRGGARPGRLSAGRTGVAGIIGADALVNRTGSEADAVAYLEGIIADREG